jgi:hypothetical protein
MTIYIVFQLNGSIEGAFTTDKKAREAIHKYAKDYNNNDNIYRIAERELNVVYGFERTGEPH